MNHSPDYVILLHGYLRTKRSMKTLEHNLSALGYRVINVQYPSRKKSIQRIADEHLLPAIQNAITKKNIKIHFVTHSMGGIVVRYFLTKYTLDNLGKVIMLAPPNHGAKLADWFGSIVFLKSFFGPALQQLQTHHKSLPNTLDAPTYEVGIVAGKYDGKVPLKNTHLPRMADFLIVPRVHTCIMNADEVVLAIKNFLVSGKFNTPVQ